MADFIFDAEVDDIKPKDGPTGPQRPYIGGLKYKGISDDPIVNKAGTTFDTFCLEFELTEGPEKGVTYKHVEWDPSTPEKAVNLFKRLTFIIAQYYPGEDNDEAYAKVRTQLKASGFEDLKQKATALLKKLQAAGHMEAVLKGKLVGGVNNKNGKPVSPKFPNYTGFLANERTNRDIVFSNNEITENEGYMAALTENPSQVSGSDPATLDTPALTAGATKDNFDF